MAKPIDHDVTSAAATGISRAAVGGAGGFLGGGIIGGIVGFLAPILTGAAIGALAIGGVVLGGGMLAALTPWVTAAGAWGAAVASAGVGAAVGGIIGIVPGVPGAIAGTATGSTIGTIGGGFLGLASGGKKVVNEKTAYAQMADRRAHTQDSKLNDAGLAGMQQGYQQGFAEGAQVGAQKGAELKEQEIMAQLQQAHDQLRAAHDDVILGNAGISKEPGEKAAKVAHGRDHGHSHGAPAVA